MRRDHIDLEKGDGNPDGVNQLAGKVHAIEYQGTYVKVTLEVPDNEAFVANVPDARYFNRPIDIGDQVVAAWKAEEVHLLTGDLGMADAAEAGPYDKDLEIAS